MLPFFVFQWGWTSQTPLTARRQYPDQATIYTYYASLQVRKNYPREERQASKNTPSADELQKGFLLQGGPAQALRMASPNLPALGSAESLSVSTTLH